MDLSGRNRRCYRIVTFQNAVWFDFIPHQCMLDVAGACRGMVVSIAKRYPHLRGIGMDLPPVCKEAAESIKANGLAGRCNNCGLPTCFYGCVANSSLQTGPF